MAEAESSAADTMTETADDVSDYLDVDRVELYEEDFQAIRDIRKLSDTTKDKFTFTIFTMDIMLSGFICGYVPQYYYIFYTLKAALLLSHRWYTYKKMKFHYFLMDFCYFNNFLVLLYLWLPSYFNAVRGMLFPTVFGFTNGPVLAAIVLWRNSLVPHSADKMTSMFIHTSPALALWGIRWFTNEQDFPLCSVAGPEECTHSDVWEIVVYPLALYFLWQLSYIVVIFVWRKKKIEEHQYETSYGWIVEKAKRGFLYKLFGMFGPKYRKPMFIAWQFIYTALSMLLVYPCYHNREFNIALATAVLTVASYNGASFYIDVFSQRYYKDTVQKKNT